MVMTMSLIICVIANPLSAKDLRASLAYLPVLIDDADTGGYVDFVRAIDDAYPDGRIIRKVYPLVRSVNNVLTGKADFHVPMIVNPLIPEASLPFRFSTEDIGFVVFVLYTHTRHPLTRSDLLHAEYTLTHTSMNELRHVTGLERLSELIDATYPSRETLLNAVKPLIPDNATFERFKDDIARAAFPYAIETDRAITALFPFPLTGSAAVDQGLKKLNAGRIDGYIFAQEETDFVLSALKLKEVRREKYQRFEVKLVISKDASGQEVDRLLTDAIRKLKASGRHQVLVEQVHVPYQEWQPADMGWE
jgi:polar amino acid transport system substrate-binding protein